MLKRIVIFLIFIVWPLSLFLANTNKDFLKYIFPFFEPKLVLIPIIFLIILTYKNRFILLILSLLIVFAFIWKPFFGQTIFVSDYQEQQKILQEQKLYNSIFLARLFQNKARIPMEKFANNFFALVDPNNYFFGFAPRQITVDNQNLKKFPFLSLPFLLIGIYYLFEKKQKQNLVFPLKKIVLAFLFAAIINLSLLTNFDRNDFILWIPIGLIILYGLNIFNKKFKYAKYYYLLFIFFASIEILRIIIK